MRVCSDWNLFKYDNMRLIYDKRNELLPVLGIYYTRSMYAAPTYYVSKKNPPDDTLL